MCWEFNEFIFCRNQQTLTRNHQKVTLEPLVVEVLEYFCQHPDTLISREQLIEDVWQARAVTDNAVSRVIAKLRKHLNDNPRAPQFIATFPKMGYRFIAPVRRVQPQEQPRVVSPKQRPGGLIGWYLVAAAFLLVSGWWLLRQSDPQVGEVQRSVEVLTRGGGDETMPAISPDGRYLVYAEMIQGRMHLFLKDLESDERLEIGQTVGWNGPASWSQDGKQLVYLNTTGTESRYFLQALEGLKLGKPEMIYQGPRGSASKMIFTHDPEELIFAQRDDANNPYVLYSLNLKTKATQRLPQPALVRAGHYQFDLHPIKNELLISSPNTEHWLGLYRLDLESGELDQLFELQAFTCCAIWGHEGERIVIKGDHPAQTLLSFDLAGQQRRELLRVPFRVSTPARFPNGEDYVFAGGRLNRDLFHVSYQDQKREVIVSSSVDDRLTALSPNGQQIAYISERSGSDEVWIVETDSLTTRKLTAFEDGRHYFDLAWSPDGSALAGLTINEIHVIDVDLGRSHRLEIDNPRIRGISWRDSETLAFSLHLDGQWRAHVYHLPNHRLETLEEPWAFVRFALNPKDHVWIHRDGALFFGEDQKALDVQEPQALIGPRFAVVKKGQKLFYLKELSSSYALMVLDLESQVQNELFQLAYPLGFAAGETGIYFSDLETYSRDIYRSKSQP